MNGIYQFLMKYGQKAAAGGNRFNALFFQCAGGFNKRLEQQRISFFYHSVRGGPFYHPVSHRKRKSILIAHISGNTREYGVEHNNANGRIMTAVSAVIGIWHECRPFFALSGSSDQSSISRLASASSGTALIGGRIDSDPIWVGDLRV